MFKRVAKHIRKKEREEELGLDGDMKEMLGMNDVDSDSDSSSSDSDEDGSDEEIPTRDGAFAGADDSEDEEEESGSGEEGAGELEEDDDESDGEGSGEDGEMEGLDEEDESEEGDEDEPPLSVSEALQNPLYLVSLEPEVKACIVCPGKLIKNPIMAEVHLKSNAHTRRFGRLRETAMNVDADTDVRQVVRAALTPQTPRPTGAMSKRAQKKRSWRLSRPSARSRKS
ncbi:hypothetical protein BV20DRAFT_454445 [Pilatotrama ljubarskyi]|nr:hypothetical protein BV20DRAFT_454445 [Pilatotrama ljubarskyi]